MPLDLLKRFEKGSPLSHAEVDQNWTDIENMVNSGVVTLEMFGGGVDETGAENYQAIIDAVASVSANPDTFGGAGAVIELGYGTYQIGDTVHLKKQVVFRGKGGAGTADSPHATIFQFPADKHGFVVHRFDTFGETSSAGVLTMGQTYVAGVIRHRTSGQIYSLTTAGAGVTSVVPTHTSGTVTGADGYAWKWEAPATAADGTLFENFAILGGYSLGGITTGHGIWGRARFDAKEMHLKRFAQNGYHIWAGSSASAELRGNANNFRIYSGRVTGCTNGIFIRGPDANAGVLTAVDFSSNRGWGVIDESFLGNRYFGVHTNGNGTAAQRQYDRSIYMCIDTDLGPTTTPGTDADVWVRTGASGAGATIVDWLSGTTYDGDGPGADLGDYVESSSHRVYRCVTAGAGSSTNEPLFTGTAEQTLADGYRWHPTTGEVWFSGDTTIVGGGSFSFPVTANNQTGVLIGCYAENGQAIVLAPNTIILPGSGLGQNDLSESSTGILWNQEGINKFRKFAEASDGNSITVSHFYEQDVLMSLVHSVLAPQARRTQLDFTSGGLMTRYQNVDTLRTEYDTLAATTVTFGRASAVPHAKFIDRLHTGLYNSNLLSNGRRITYATAVPATGEWARGDVIFNHTPSVGQPAGWMCVTSGTAGAGAAFAAMANLV